MYKAHAKQIKSNANINSEYLFPFEPSRKVNWQVKFTYECSIVLNEAKVHELVIYVLSMVIKVGCCGP